MDIPYFPGCTLSTTATGFDKSVRASCAALGCNLVEIPDWNCCGATFPLLTDNMLDLTGPTRVLVAARKIGTQVTTACTTCYNVIKRTNAFLRRDEEAREKINYFIEADYQGDVEVTDILQVLRDQVGFDKIREAVKKPLTGLRVASYYGCMVLRPPQEVAYDDPEAPHALDDLMAALDAEPVDWPHKNECCGAYLAIKSEEVTREMVHTILASAQLNGAQVVVTNCPVCQFNLDRQQMRMTEQYASFQAIPVLYFTQLLGLALGLDGSDFGWEKHYIDPRPLLQEKKLLV